MATITLKGNPIETRGKLPKIGKKAPKFSLINAELSKVKLKDLKGSKLILNIFPSLDTETCAASVRRFNKVASELENTKVLCISRDLPFAQSRFCGAEGLENVITLSDFSKGKFGKKYGATIKTGPLANLLSRAIVIVNEEGIVTYTQQVPEIVDEPNYEDALKAL